MPINAIRNRSIPTITIWFFTKSSWKSKLKYKDTSNSSITEANYHENWRRVRRRINSTIVSNCNSREGQIAKEEVQRIKMLEVELMRTWTKCLWSTRSSGSLRSTIWSIRASRQALQKRIVNMSIILQGRSWMENQWEEHQQWSSTAQARQSRLISVCSKIKVNKLTLEVSVIHKNSTRVSTLIQDRHKRRLYPAMEKTRVETWANYKRQPQM